MAEHDITQTTYTSMDTRVTDYSVTPMTIDAAGEQKETYWDNFKWSQYLGYYKTIPELKSAINALATWILGQGYDTDTRNRVILENITGWGEDTFTSILWNMIVTKKVAGDSFAEIIRDEKTGILLNLKPLGPESVRIVCNRKGKIIRYEQRSKTGTKEPKRTFRPEEILHLCNDRIADEIHGTSIIEACQWVIDARNEAMSDYRRILHRSSIRIMYVDEDDKTRLADLKRDYAEAIKKGELLLLPGKKEQYPIEDLNPPAPETFLGPIRYYEGFFYQALGVPKVILGGTAENTEASAKISVVVYEPTFIREITELEMDIWNQLGIRITIKKQPSLMDNMQDLESKNQAQVGFQPNDTIAGRGK